MAGNEPSATEEPVEVEPADSLIKRNKDFSAATAEADCPTLKTASRRVVKRPLAGDSFRLIRSAATWQNCADFRFSAAKMKAKLPAVITSTAIRKTLIGWSLPTCAWW